MWPDSSLGLCDFETMLCFSRPWLRVLVGRSVDLWGHWVHSLVDVFFRFEAFSCWTSVGATSLEKDRMITLYWLEVDPWFAKTFSNANNGVFQSLRLEQSSDRVSPSLGLMAGGCWWATVAVSTSKLRTLILQLAVHGPVFLRELLNGSLPCGHLVLGGFGGRCQDGGSRAAGPLAALACSLFFWVVGFATVGSDSNGCSCLEIISANGLMDLLGTFMQASWPSILFKCFSKKDAAKEKFHGQPWKNFCKSWRALFSRWLRKKGVGGWKVHGMDQMLVTK